MPLFIGLMSGTSADGVDGVLVEFPVGAPQADAPPLHVLAEAGRPIPRPLAAEILALNRRDGSDELHRAALVANAMAELQAAVVAQLLADSGLGTAAITAVGSHGQTVRHQPGLHDGTGYTLQLNAPALLAERCGIPVVADFRSRDVAAGGQGAPLVPAFHQAVFGGCTHRRALLNLGGIANLSILAPSDPAGPPTSPLGFDCGPANVLLDLWCLRHQGQACDEGGRWAASGQVLPGLLARMLAEPYFALPAPKSTGRDLFHADWLDAHLAAEGAAAPASASASASTPTPAPADVQATLLELTARSALDALRTAAPHTQELLVCGGGRFNTRLMQRLGELWPGLRVAGTEAAGLPAMQVEAAAFAWLAARCVAGLPGNAPAVTGAQGPRVLGAVWPA